MTTGDADHDGRDRLRSYCANRIVDCTAGPVRQSVTGQRFDEALRLVHNGPEEIAQLVDLVAVHDQAVAGRLAGKSV